MNDRLTVLDILSDYLVKHGQEETLKVIDMFLYTLEGYYRTEMVMSHEDIINEWGKKAVAHDNSPQGGEL